MSYKKNAASNRDALFGGAPSSTSSASGGGPKHKKDASSNRDALFGDAPKTSKSSASSTKSKTVSKEAVAQAPLNAGYKGVATNRTKKPTGPSISGEAKAAKMKEAEDYREKANKAMQKSFFSKPDPVAASTFFKRAADCYKQCGESKLERLFRLESAECNRQIAAWASAASDYTRAASLMLEADDIKDIDMKRKEASRYHKLASAAHTQMGEKAKAAESMINSAIALSYGDKTTLLSNEALTQLEEAIEAHVPDVFNPHARYRQTGCSSFIDPNSDETVENPYQETLTLAQEHIVTRAYAHEPLMEVVYTLVHYGEYASALYAAGAASTILERDQVSTLSLSRAYAVETILMLAMGDPIAAEQAFLNRHVQKTAYLTSRECKLSEELFRAVKTRDGDALEEARSPEGSNRAALANLHQSVRTLVTMLRLSGAARKHVPETTVTKKASSSSGKKKKKSSSPEPDEKVPRSLKELDQLKTGYEDEVTAGANLDTNVLQDELDNLNFDLDNEENESEDDLDDDDIDLR